MKSRKQIETKLVEISRSLVGTEGSKAYGLRKQIELIDWVLNGIKKGAEKKWMGIGLLGLVLISVLLI